MGAFFRGYSLKVITWSRYIGVFVGMEAAQAWWLEYKLEGWRVSVAIMAEWQVEILQIFGN